MRFSVDKASFRYALGVSMFFWWVMGTCLSKRVLCFVAIWLELAPVILSRRLRLVLELSAISQMRTGGTERLC